MLSNWARPEKMSLTDLKVNGDSLNVLVPLMAHTSPYLLLNLIIPIFITEKDGIRWLFKQLLIMIICLEMHVSVAFTTLIFSLTPLFTNI